VLLAASQNWRKELEGLVHWYVRENPDDAEVQLAVADFFAANGRWEQSIPLFTRAIKHDPGQTELYFKRGVARMRANYSGAAVEDFRRVLAADAKRYEARFFLGNCLLGDARIDEAERELVVCSHERPDDIEPRVSLAACALERNDLAKAESLLLEALKRDGNSPLVLQELGSLYLRQQRHEMAMAALRKLVAIDREHRHGHLMLAQALLAAGDLGEARKHEQIYKELDRKEEERLAARRGMR
jgi:tetratricopeptide (TPR) repeat protein